MSFIPRLLDLLLSLLEAFFTKPKIHHNEHDYSSHDPEQRVQALEAACSFFELDSETLSRDDVKKKYRRLSKMHHPDRNGNTQESVEISQKINNFNLILNEELDRREGIHHDESEEEEEEEEVPKEQEPTDAPKKKNRKQQSKSAARRAKKRQRRRERQREERQRAQMNEAMKKEEAEIRRQRHEVKREQQTKTKQAFQTKMNQGLDTKEGRERAYREWKEAIDNMQVSSQSDSNEEEKKEEETAEAVNGSGSLDDIDGDEAGEIPDTNDNDTNGPSEEPAPEATAVPAKSKPLNLVMECCMKEVVVALRMGHTDVVLDRMQCDMVEDVITTVVLSAIRSGSNEVNHSEIAEPMAKSLTQALDEDGNTLLHYAVYYESSDTIGALYYFANTFDILAEVFLKENAYGMIPLDFTQCCVKDESLPARMKVHTDAAREDLANKQVWPSLKKSARRLWGVISNLDVSALLGPMNFVASYLIGRHLYRCGLMSSFLLALVPTFSTSNKIHRGHAATLFSSHLTWGWCYYLQSLLSWTMLVLLISIAFLGYFVWPKSEWFGLACVGPPALIFYPTVCLLEALEQSFRFPAAIKSGSEVDRSACLLVFTIWNVLVRMAVRRFHGTEKAEVMAEESISDEFASFE